MAQQLRLAFNLHETGKQIIAARRRRKCPHEDKSAIQTRLGRWLREHPGARGGRGTKLAAHGALMQLQRVPENLATELGELRVDWTLLGGLAVSADCRPRFTCDVDVTIANSYDAQPQGWTHALRQRGYRQHGTPGRLAAGHRADNHAWQRRGCPVADLLFASSGSEVETVQHPQTVEISDGFHPRVATVGHLVLLKLLSRDGHARPQDAADLRAPGEEVDAAHRETGTSLGAIRRRG